MPSRSSVCEDGSVVSGVDNEVVVSHSVLFSFCTSARKMSLGESRGERRKGGFDGELENYPSVFALFYMDGLLLTEVKI